MEIPNEKLWLVVHLLEEQVQGLEEEAGIYDEEAASYEDIGQHDMAETKANHAECLRTDAKNLNTCITILTPKE